MERVLTAPQCGHDRVNCLSGIRPVNRILLFLPMVRAEKCAFLVHTILCSYEPHPSLNWRKQIRISSERA